VAARTQTINRLHRLLLDLVPGGTRGNLTTKRAAGLLAGVTPAGQPAVTRWQLAGELVTDARQLEQRIAVIEARIKTAVAQANTSLLELFGVGRCWRPGSSVSRRHRPVPDQAPVRRPHRHRPLEASNGQVFRHRLSRAGDRKLNHALYMMAIVADPTSQQRAGLLPAQAGRGQVLQGSTALSAAAALGRHLPVPAR
jgi:transposase